MADHQHINYTSKDIEMYLGGQLTAGQMHAMEKAALDDPMLADALEGYATVDINEISPGSQELLERLKSRLSKDEKQKTPVILLKRNNWLRIAALFILVAGLGLVISRFSYNQNKNEIATAEKPGVDTGLQTDIAITNNERDKQDSAVSGIMDKKNEELVTSKRNEILKPQQTQTSTEEINGESVAKLEVQTEDSEAAAKLQQAGLADRQAKETIDIETMNAKRDVTQNAFAKTAGKPMAKIAALSQPVITLSGRVLDQKNNPVPYAVISNPKDNVLVAADSAGYFSMLTADTTLAVEISSLGFQNSTAFLQDRNRNNIILKESNETLNEVVVTGYESRKKSSDSQLPPEPVTGWEKYFQYLDEKQSRADFLSPGQQKGIVELTFIVNKKGEPENIRVSNSDCNACNSEAIRLVKEGPAWKLMGKNQNVKLQVSFSSN